VREIKSKGSEEIKRNQKSQSKIKQQFSANLKIAPFFSLSVFETRTDKNL
jgi:hypothetical protein